MIKVANSPTLIKLVNPARMQLNDDTELMVILNLQEAPSVAVSEQDAEEQKATEVVEEKQAAGSKKSKKAKKAPAANEQKPSSHHNITRQNSPMPAEMKPIALEVVNQA